MDPDDKGKETDNWVGFPKHFLWSLQKIGLQLLFYIFNRDKYD